MNTIINISPLNTRLLNNSVVSDKRLSNSAIINAFLQLVSGTEITPILPLNCIQYIRKNRSYIIVQEFDPCITDAYYTVTTPDIIADMRHYKEHYQDRCRNLCPESFNDCDSDNCSDCDIDNSFYETIDGYREGDEITFEQIPTPRLLFVFVLGIQKGQYFTRKCFIKALLGPITKPSDFVFNVPMGNIYEESSICWGDTEFDPSYNLMFTSSVLSRFYSSPFNADLEHSPYNQIALEIKLGLPYYSTRNFLYAIQHKPHFDPEWLLLFNRGRSNITYEEFINDIVRISTI